MNDGDNIEEPEQTVFRVRRHGKIKVTRAVWCVLHGALALALRERHSTQDGADLRLPEATLNRFKEGGGRALWGPVVESCHFLVQLIRLLVVVG